MTKILNAHTGNMAVRSNKGPWAVMAATSVGLPLIGGAVGLLTGYAVMPSTMLPWTLSITGATIGAVGTSALQPYFFVRNGIVNIFVTIDRLQSLLYGRKVYILYEQGNHPAYPWEDRRAENNIIIKEVSQEFTFFVQCKDGTLEGKGSFRLRPDADRPVEFLQSVAAIAPDLIDLVVVDAVEQLADTEVINASKNLRDLNEKLKRFSQGHGDKTEDVSRFEGRFGVTVGDVTVSQLLPSKELQRTIAAITEAAAIKQGTALLLGMSMDEVQAGLKDKSLPENRYEKARRDFMSISGNLEGMEVKRQEFALEGLTPEIAQAIIAMAQQVGAISRNVPTKKGK